MGLIREPLEVDFTVDTRPLTKEEKSAITEYIRAYKSQTQIMPVPAMGNAKGASKRTVVKY